MEVGWNLYVLLEVSVQDLLEYHLGWEGSFALIQIRATQ